jgi:hypothetical protein
MECVRFTTPFSLALVTNLNLTFLLISIKKEIPVTILRFKLINRLIKTVNYPRIDFFKPKVAKPAATPVPTNAANPTG